MISIVYLGMFLKFNKGWVVYNFFFVEVFAWVSFVDVEMCEVLENGNKVEFGFGVEYFFGDLFRVDDF